MLKGKTFTKCDLIKFIIAQDSDYRVNALWAKEKKFLYRLAVKLGWEEKNDTTKYN